MKYEDVWKRLVVKMASYRKSSGGGGGGNGGTCGSGDGGNGVVVVAVILLVAVIVCMVMVVAAVVMMMMIITISLYNFLLHRFYRPVIFIIRRYIYFQLPRVIWYFKHTHAYIYIYIYILISHSIYSTTIISLTF